ncbi:MAG: hypothetical protein LBT38_10670 [Deltaproteobacteria bacterium]|jgi:hypothetical protein|nr:hypothetical protein [Deltaproteobacteria bacterium]
MFGRLALVNAGAIIALIVAYFFRRLLEFFIGVNAFLTITTFLSIVIVLFFYLYFSYDILFRRNYNSKHTFDGKKIESLPIYIQLLNDYIKNNIYTFKNDLSNLITLCEKFIKKREGIVSSLLSHFNANELSYNKFMSVINGVENSFAVTVNNSLLRLNSFDEAEYVDIFRKKAIQGPNLANRQKIFDEYVEFFKSAQEYLDALLVKLDQLQLEITKLSSLDYQDIEKNELIIEITSLVHNMKLYK